MAFSFALAGCIERPEHRSIELIEPPPPTSARVDYVPDDDPIPTVNVVEEDADPLCEIRSSRGDLIHRGRDVSVTRADDTRVDRLVITELAPKRRHTFHTRLLDPTSRRTLATIPRMSRLMPRLERLVVADAQPQLTRIDSGRTVVLDATLPDGTPARRPMLIVHEASDYVWAVGQDESGAVFGAVWADLDEPAVTLQTPLPLRVPTDPGAYYLTRWTRGLDMIAQIRACQTPASLADASMPCSRIRLERGGAVQCVARGEGTCSMDAAAFIADHHAVLGEFQKTEILRADGHPDELPPSDEPWTAELFSSSVPHVLFASRLGEGDRARFAVWTPDGVRELVAEAPRAPNNYWNQRWYGTVWTLEALTDGPTSLFLDIEQLEVFRVPRMRPLGLGFAGNRQFYALDATVPTRRLLYTDLDQRRTVALHEYPECPETARIHELATHGTRVAIGCLNEAKGRFYWSEVIDLAEGWRARTKRRVEEIMADGSVVVSNRSRADIEEPGDGTALWWLRLGSRDHC